MLERLSVKDFALFESIEAAFDPGFNVMTGETGAGKSLLVDALFFLLGDRMSPDLLREGADRAAVEAIFRVPDAHPALARLSDWGIPAPGGEVLVKREYHRSPGRTRSTVNGEMATAPMVAELGDLLVDIHGQHEHQAVFNVGRHRQLVDSFGRLENDRTGTARGYERMMALLAERSNLGGDSLEIARRVDLLRFQVNEIEAAGIRDVDEEGLRKEYQVLKHAERISSLLGEAARSLEEEGGASAVRGIGNAAARVREAARLDPDLEPLVETLTSLQEQAVQSSFEIIRKAENTRFDEERYRELSERIDALHLLKKKYGRSVADVAAFLQEARRELDSLSNREDRLRDLDHELTQAAEAYRDAADRLEAARTAAGRRLAAGVEKTLRELGLTQARFEVQVTPQEDPSSCVRVSDRNLLLSPHGWDRVEFLFSANPGEPPRPLARVASGGEASRVMLALKSVLAGSDDTPTLIFDEVDTGVGGRTAADVGRVLARLAVSRQVICISHLAPIACMGENHLQVLKSFSNGRTMVGLKRLEGGDRLEELARMMAGRVSETSLKHARELFEQGRSRTRTQERP